MREGQCKQSVWDKFHEHQCTRKAWKDGYCKQHHPESVAKREREAQKRHEEKKKLDPYYKLAIMRKRLTDGRDYLVSTPADKITVEDALEAFGFRRDGVI